MQDLDRVQMEGVVAEAVGGRRVRVLERDVTERVPLPHHQPGAEIDLLHDRVQQRRELARGRARQVREDRRFDREQRLARRASAGTREGPSDSRCRPRRCGSSGSACRRSRPRRARTRSGSPSPATRSAPRGRRSRCGLKFVATSGGASWSNQTSWPRRLTIIGPPGPTGVIVSSLLLSGWTIGDGSGVRKMSPPPRDAPRWTVILGASSDGCETKWSSLFGCSVSALMTGGTGARRATVKARAQRPLAAQPDEHCDALALGQRRAQHEARAAAAL